MTLPTPADALGAHLDDDGRVVEAGPGIVPLMAATDDAARGLVIDDLLTPDHAVRWQAEMAAPTGSSFVIAGRRHDGLPFRAVVALWRSSGGGAGPVVLVGRRQNGPVGWAADASEPTGHRLAGLDTVLSHDLRGALRGATGFTTVVKRTLESITPGDERLAKAVEHLDIAGRSLTVADEMAMQAVRHLRWEAVALRAQVVAVADLVAAADAEARARADGWAPATVTFDADRGHRVVVDLDLATWAVAELLVNAAKFHRADRSSSTVSVTCSGDAHWCVLNVRDDGIGVDPALAEDAFLPGRKLQPRGDYPGVGMGLALARLVVERHAGGCWITADQPSSSDGAGDRSGTDVVIRLPSGTAPGPTRG